MPFMVFLSKVLVLSLIMAVNYLDARQYNPVADSGAVVTQGHARFTVLTNHVIRMEYAPNDSFVDLASLTFVNRYLSVPDFKVAHTNGWLIITSGFATLHYLENSGAFTAHNLSVEYRDSTHGFTWKPGIKDRQNLKGTTRTLDGVLGKSSFYGMRKIQLEDGLLSRSGWALIDDWRGRCLITATGPG